MNSLKIPPTQNNVLSLVPVKYDDQDKYVKLTFDTGSVGGATDVFTPSVRPDTYNGIFLIYHSRNKSKNIDYVETIQVPEFKIRCKKSGFYCFSMKVTTSMRGTPPFYNLELSLNGIVLTQDYKYYNSDYYATEFVFTRYFNSGDILCVKHRGGSRTNSDNVVYVSWEDDTIRFQDTGNSGYNMFYSLTAIAWDYEILVGNNGELTFNPSHESSNFEAYV